MLNIPVWPGSHSTPCASGRVGTAITPALLMPVSWSTALQFMLHVRSGSLELLVASDILGEGLVPTPDCYHAVVSRQKCTKPLRAICSLRLWRKNVCWFWPWHIYSVHEQGFQDYQSCVFWKTIKSPCLLQQYEKTFTSTRLTFLFPQLNHCNPQCILRHHLTEM